MYISYVEIIPLCCILIYFSDNKVSSPQKEVIKFTTDKEAWQEGGKILAKPILNH